MIVNMFSCYNHILMYVTANGYIFNTFVTEGVSSIYSLIIQGFLIYLAEKTMNTLKKVPLVVINIVNSKICDDENREILKSFLSQIQYRNLNLENSLFVINWKLLLAVRFKIDIYEIIRTLRTVKAYVCYRSRGYRFIHEKLNKHLTSNFQLSMVF
jgi:hypothetical protein